MLTKEQRKQRYRAIRSEMAKYGVTNREIARICGVRENYIYMVMIGERTGYEKIRPVIARMCKTTIEALWPDTPLQYREAA